MILRRFLFTALLVLPLGAAGFIPATHAQQPPDDVHVVQSTPAAHDHIGPRSSDFYVRFDRPVDHIKSTLVIMQGDRVVEKLTPRLESAPEVLFARAPTLPDGSYTMHWTVVTLQGKKAISGDIPFDVSDQPAK